MRILLILFPLLELWLLLKVGTWLGAMPTIALVLLSAALGMALLRSAGWQTLSLAQLRIRQRTSPMPTLVNGFMLALAGVLLILPGLISDGVGLLLLIAPLRRRLSKRWASRVSDGFRADDKHTESMGRPRPIPDIIEGEYRREA